MKTASLKKKSIIAFFATQSESESAIIKLSENAFDMQSLSIIAMDLCAVETIKGRYTLIDRMKKWGNIGAAYGAFWGLLFGANVFTIPFIGHLLVAGPLTVIIITVAAAGAVGTLSALAGLLTGLIISGKSHLKYHTEIKAGRYALLGQCDEAAVAKARKILKVDISENGGTIQCNTNEHESGITGMPSGVIHLNT